MLTHKSNTAIFGLLMLLLLCLHSFLHPLPWFLFVLVALVYFALLSWGSAQIHSNYHLAVICSGKENGKQEIAISFDDGPDAETTPAVLDLLKKHGLTATFFCIGKKIEGKEKLLKRMFDEGHIIANHSFSHSYFFDFFGPVRIKNELLRTNLEIERVIGKKANYFRPPYGVTTPNIANAVEKLQLKTIGWNIRSMDAVEKDEKKIIETVTSQIKSGAIILFHDTNSRVLPALEATILHCQKNGFKIVPLNRLINCEPYVKDE